MKKIICTSLSIAFIVATASGQGFPPQPISPQSPAPVYSAPTPPQSQMVYTYDQKPLASAPELIPGDQAQAIVDTFKTNYTKWGNPRILIYINRDLVDSQSGLKLSSRTEKVENTVRTTVSSSTNNTNANPPDSVTTQTTANNQYYDNGKAEPTLADRQTVRDVERLMGRPLRSAGATLVDQHVAAQLLDGRPLDLTTTENVAARKDREAINQIADIVVEVLISSKNVTVPGISGSQTYSVPDIQMTAIRLKDAKMLGQASASDVINKAGGAGYAARNYGVEAITETTALALMDDMSQEAK